MNKPLPLLFAFLFVNFTMPAQEAGNKIGIHSHNDYAQRVPFWEAFSSESSSIEADVFFKDGVLYVTHDEMDIQKEHTLTSMYLKPLSEVIKSKRYSNFDLQLLIDFKSAAEPTLNALLSELNNFPEIKEAYKSNKKLTLVISGNRPLPEKYGSYPDYIMFDHQSLSDIEKIDLDKVAMVSFPFRIFSVWNGKGRLTQADENRLKTVIEKIHKLKKPIRFWGSPDSKTAWYTFTKLGVNYINTDQPHECNSYLKSLESNLVNFTKPGVLDNSRRTEILFDRQPVNVILMIGDGNGLAQISSGMYANGNHLSMLSIKDLGLVKTQSAEDFTTDSAAGATALATGEKTNNRYIGVGPDGKNLLTIFDYLKQRQYLTGIITTDAITGATPSAFYGHTNERDNSEKLLADLNQSEVDVFIGGGAKYLQEKKLNDSDRNYLISLNDWDAMDSGKVGILAAYSGLPSKIQGRGEYLPEATDKTLRHFNNRKKPFMLMIENGHIDSGGHANNAEMVVSEEIDFDKAIKVAMDFVDENKRTLLIITADHETGGISLPHGNLESAELELQFHSDDHTGIMVPLFAYGAGAENFRGVFENTEIFNKIMSLLKIEK